MNLKICFEKARNHDLCLPSYATEQSAGIDFSACLLEGFIKLASNDIAMVSLGYKMEMKLSTSHVMMLFVRSSVGKKGLVLANGTGIIDQDYRGELFACIRNVSNEELVILHGERIVQGIIMPAMQYSIYEDVVEMTKRGEGGFGSTGK